MMRRARSFGWLTVLCLGALFVGTAHAYAPKMISYQGVLTDDLGTPLDGSYNLTFKLYSYPPVFLDLPSWQETQNGVQVTGGYFAVDLGSVNPIDFILGGDYVLGITVNGGTELTPRIPLRSAPYAMALRMPFGATVNDVGSALFVRNNGTGAAIEAVGTLKVTWPGALHSVAMNMSQSGDASVQLPPDAVASAEVLDEPGMANIASTGTTTLPAAAPATVLAQQSITAPAPGYVVATGTVEITAAGSTIPTFWMSLSDTPTIGDLEFVSSAESSGAQNVVSAQTVFQVAAGVKTIYLVARTGFSAFDVGTRQLTLMYFPTAYGTTTVEASPAP